MNIIINHILKREAARDVSLASDRESSQVLQVIVALLNHLRELDYISVRNNKTRHLICKNVGNTAFNIINHRHAADGHGFEKGVRKPFEIGSEEKEVGTTAKV